MSAGFRGGQEEGGQEGQRRFHYQGVNGIVQIGRAGRGRRKVRRRRLLGGCLWLDLGVACPCGNKMPGLEQPQLSFLQPHCLQLH